MPINPYNNGTVPQAPFGDIYAIRTPKTDAAVLRLQQHQWQQEQYEQQRKLAQAAAMEKDLDRQLTGVRDADVEDVAQAYNDYATAKKDLLFNPAYNKNMIDRAKKEREVNKLKTQYYGTVQSSKQTADFQKKLNAGFLKDPYAYHDATPEMLTEANTTSTKALNEKGWNDGGAWAYQNGNADLTKQFTDAYGKGKEVVLDLPAEQGSLQKYTQRYKVPDEPAQVYDKLLTNFGKNNQAKTFMYQFHRDVTPDMEATVNALYDAKLNDRDVWGKMGIDPQPINADPNNPMARAAAFYAKKNFLDNPPTAGAKQAFTDLKKSKDYDFANRLKAMAIAQGYKKEMAQLHAKLKGKDDTTWADDAFDVIRDPNATLEQKQEVFNRLKAAGKKNFDHYEVKMNTNDGGMRVTYDVTEKDASGLPVTLHKGFDIDPKDDMSYYYLTHFESEVKGLTGKQMSRVVAGDGKAGLVPKKTKTTTKKKKLY